MTEARILEIESIDTIKRLISEPPQMLNLAFRLTAATAALFMTYATFGTGPSQRGNHTPSTATATKAPSQKLEVSVEKRGKIVIELHSKQAPLACAHIVSLAQGGFYDGQRFFKVIKSPKPYLIQAGDPTSKAGDLNSQTMGEGGSGVTVPYENSGFRNLEGAVALATRNGNRNSGDSQFYILLNDYDSLLDGSATVFGQVTQGLDVVDRVELGDRITSVKVTQD